MKFKPVKMKSVYEKAFVLILRTGVRGRRQVCKEIRDRIENSTEKIFLAFTLYTVNTMSCTRIRTRRGKRRAKITQFFTIYYTQMFSRTGKPIRNERKPRGRKVIISRLSILHFVIFVVTIIVIRVVNGC